jgi:hypothetical protein
MVVWIGIPWIGIPTRVPTATCRSGKRLCAEIKGFSVHAATRCRVGDRSRLARPAFADDQLSWDGAGLEAFEPKTPQLKDAGRATAQPISR